MKADKHEIEMICDWEMSTALKRREMRSVGESVAVEFGTVDNLGDNQLRYKYNSLSYTHLIILVHLLRMQLKCVNRSMALFVVILTHTCTKGLL